MNTLSLTLSNSQIIEYNVSEANLKYWNLKLEDLRLEVSGTYVGIRNLRINQILLHLISVTERSFANCCGLVTWENLLVERGVSKQLFDTWIQWILSRYSIPIIIVIVRYCDKD